MSDHHYFHGLLTALIFVLGEEEVCPSPEVEVQLKRRRSVHVQGPVTYKSRSKSHTEADGRYTPLGSREWGAWADDDI